MASERGYRLVSRHKRVKSYHSLRANLSTMDRMTGIEVSQREEIREKARDLGSSRTGFCRLDPPAHGDAFRTWLSRGFHANLDWMAGSVERRLRPNLLLENSASAIVIAVDYQATAPAKSRTGAMTARYAVGPDYHQILDTILALLGDHIEDRFGAKTAVFVDTAPILERELAMRAGLGFIGKNTMLINQQCGSWFFLGEILTTLEIPPDEPAILRCGTCRRCLDACPTEALRGPFQLDANRCIAYQTIENRRLVPRHLRPAVSHHSFGCDLCQEICPWNRQEKATPHPAFDARRAMEPAECLEQSHRSFRARFGQTSFYRAGRNGLAADVCLTASRDTSLFASSLLKKGLAHPSGKVRAHAAWAVARRERRRRLRGL